jgi:oxygen-independent coproporphyrinogen-3 oxidase
VLPHPFCNPAVAGCGFCTFPHEPYRADRAGEVVAHVVREIDLRLAGQPALSRRRVAGLYFGGGTANLTPAGPFRLLCRRLAAAFDLSDAEVTLEGVPAYSLKARAALLDVLREELPARHFRLSMGVQTFDAERLRQMGRLAFGTADTFAAVVEAAHARGFTASADLLFNLPGQALDEMRRDVARAVDIGLDHLGLYHLVLFRGLGTAWSRDPDLVAALPDNETAAGHWQELRRALLGGGFVQTTLTNFERARFRGDRRRFLYEELSFRPDRTEVLGLGPGAVSFAADAAFTSGLKVLNPDGAAAYTAAVRGGGEPWDRFFAYGPADLSVFYLTRRLAALNIDRGDHDALFGIDPLDDFAAPFAALEEEGLVEVTPSAIRPTPRGMFYADSIAALFAWKLAGPRPGRRPLPVLSEEEKAWLTANDNGAGHM